MKIKYGQQVEILDINNTIDVFIMANNFEERKFYAYDELIKNSILIINKISFFYNNSVSLDEKKDFENYFIQNNNEINDIIESKVSGLDKKTISIFIDYSCMTKSWYYSIINYFSNIETEKEINVFYSYTPSHFVEPRETKIIKEYYPIYKSYLPDNKPKFLIVCLGYEQNKAQGIIDYLDPKEVKIFYTKPAIEEKFVKKVEENNEEVINLFNENIITFPFNDLLFLERKLKAIIEDNIYDYNIIIAPLGPKPFTYMAMMLSAIYPNIEIWRVSTELEKEPFESKPIENSLIINKIKYGNI